MSSRQELNLKLVQLLQDAASVMPEQRFNQLLTNLAIDSQDYYEESEATLKRVQERYEILLKEQDKRPR